MNVKLWIMNDEFWTVNLPNGILDFMSNNS